MAPQNIAPANSASQKAEGIGKKETTEDAKKEEAVAKKEAAEDKQKEKKAAAPQVIEDKPDWHWIQDTTTGVWLERGRHHGRFTHKFPSGKVKHSNWDHGREIAW